MQPRVYFHHFPGVNSERAKPGTFEVTLGWEGPAGLGTLSPAWIIDEMCGVEMGYVCVWRERSPICLVIKASAGSRLIGDL